MGMDPSFAAITLDYHRIALLYGTLHRTTMRSEILLFLTLLLLAPTFCPGLAAGDAPTVLVVAVHPSGSTDWEHVILENLGEAPVDLSGWSLSDGEGTWTLPAGTLLGSGGRASVGLNDSAHRLLWGRDLDIVAERAGSFCLADRGDSLVLLDDVGRVVDQMVYGASDERPPGWDGDPVPTSASVPWGRLLSRSGQTDTGTAADWTGWVEPRCGWFEDLAPRPPVLVNASCFATPEGGWDVLSWAIGSARHDLAIALYDLTSLDLAATVADRVRRGVRTRVLVEGTPVGKDASEVEWRSSLLSALVAAGADVWVTSPMLKGESHRPYRFHHEKYCVVDGTRLVVSTENWCTSSFPTQGTAPYASRGWGALIESQELADDLLEVFERDLLLSAAPCAFEDVEPLDLPLPLEVGEGPPMAPVEAQVEVGPEGWGTGLQHLLAPFRVAEASILLELAYLEVWWDGGPSPLVEALLEAAGRGVSVRVVLDPGADGEGRTAMVELLDLAARRGLREVRGVLASDLPGISRVHTKGAIIDGRTAVLGSLNWGRSSVTRNREVVIVLAGAGAVAPLVDAFGSDWNASVGRMSPSPPPSLIMEVASRWGGPTYPRQRLEPIGVEAEGDRPAGDEGELTSAKVLRTVAIVGLFVTLWALDRRYAYTLRFTTWTRGRVRRLKRRLEGPSSPPSSGEGAPGGPRTTCPGKAPATEGHRGGSPPDPPPPGSPRVVVLEEVW
jgi:phosphatidylserine/phosphatidylglycerophosphate/cardiolipin synthase-like enzyme